MHQDEPAPKGVLHRQGHRVKLDQGERVGGKAILRDKGRLPVLVLPDLARERIGFHKFTRRPHCTDLAQPIGGGSDVHAGNAFRARSAKHEQPLVRTERGADERGGLRFGWLPNPIKARREFAHPIGRTLVGIQPGEKVMLIINGSGATTLMEQLIIYRKCEQVLKEQNIEIVANYVGELLTVQEQAGFQMFMARMDDELLRLWNAPCKTPYLTK